MVSPLTFLVQELGGRPGERPPLVCISTVPEALNSILSPQPVLWTLSRGCFGTLPTCPQPRSPCTRPEKTAS